METVNFWVLDKSLPKWTVKPALIDLTDDLVTGLFLSQLVYLYRPKPSGKSAVMVEFSGRRWIAKSHKQWQDELRLGEKPIARALERLQLMGLIVQCVRVFDRVRTLHVSLDVGVLETQLNKMLTACERQDSIECTTKTSNGLPLTLPPDSHQTTGQAVSYLVENIKEHSKRIAFANASLSQEQTAVFPTAAGKENPEQEQTEEEMASLKEILEAKAKTSGEQDRPGLMWQSQKALHYGWFQTSLTHKERGQLKLMLKVLPPQVEPLEFVRWVIRNWANNCVEIEVAAGLKTSPKEPHIGFALVHVAKLAQLFVVEGVTAKAQMMAQTEVQLPQPVVLEPEASNQLDDTPAVHTPEEIEAVLAKFRQLKQLKHNG